MDSQSAKIGRPKSEAKGKSILKAASKLFLQQGYSGCSMDLVAKESGVSKQTVYSHFNNKEALFLAAISEKCAQYQLDIHSHRCEARSLIQILHQFGLQFVKLLHDEQVIAMHRLIMSEASSNPRAAELFYQAGQQHSIDALTNCFIHFSQQALAPATARLYSVTFLNLLKGEFHVRSIFGLEFALTEQQQIQQVEFAVSQLETLIDQSKPSGL